jgi:GT2 family glycosyltransferase
VTAGSADPGAGRRLAVVVLAWNSREDVLACLESLRTEVGPADAVLVADNGSADGTVDAVRRAHPWAEVLENGANLGFAAGNDAGIRRALERGFRWIWILNQDTEVQPGAVEALLAAGEAEPGAGALQPVLLSLEDPGVIDTLGLRPYRSLGGGDAERGRPASEIPVKAVPIFGASGAAAFLRAEVLRKAGLLDEELFLLCEDFDLAFRLRMAGAGALLVPAARVLHRRGVSGAQRDPAAARRRKHLLQRNTVALALRYWPARALLLAAPLLLWRAAQALLLSPADPAHPCLPLWRRYLGLRGEARRAMEARDLDRWFA